MSSLVLFAIPGFILSLVLEALWARRALRAGRPIKGYERRDTAASLAMGIGNVAISAVTKLGSFALLTVVYRHRLFTLPAAGWVWVLLFFGDDLCYYAYHRASHEVRLLWAAHVNHHSSEHYNLSTALRQSWTTPLTGPWFWLPLALLGFAPWMILTQQAISLLYQFWLHTEAVTTLGPLEWVLNTPSHHRVHHGSNVAYLDKNHGGILIIWDRLFGTFAPEREAPRYGLTTDIRTFHPLTIAGHEFAAIARDLGRAETTGDAIRYVLGPPGWTPGAATTARDLQKLKA